MPAKLALRFIVLISIISSCSDPSDLGLQLDPNNNQIGVFYTEIPLSASMVLYDSLNTTNQGNLVLGGGTSDFFGRTEGIAFSRLAINPNADLPDEESILDSVRFSFHVESVIGKNLDSPKSLQVHLLTQPILDTTYYNFDKLPFDLVPIAQGSFDFQAKTDTIVNVLMEENFSQMIFEEMIKGDFFNNIFSFRNLIPGIAIKGNVEEETSLSLRTGNSTGLFVFYHNAGDTVSTAYPITTIQSRHFNHVNSDRSGTPTSIITEMGKAYDVGPFVGLKSNLGLLLKIDTEPISEFLDTLTNVTFNQIIFEVGSLEETDSTNLPPNVMMMFFTNETNKTLYRSDGAPLTVQQDGQPQQGIDEFGNIVPAANNPGTLVYSPISKSYNQSVTSYMNALYRFDLQRADWLIYPNSPSSTGDDFRKSLREFVVNENNLKLKIYYSKIRAF